MKSRYYGWLYVVSNTTLGTRFKVHCSVVHPDDIVRKLNKVSERPSYALEYKRFMRDPFSIHEKIQRKLSYCVRRHWYHCPLSEITSIVPHEKREGQEARSDRM